MQVADNAASAWIAPCDLQRQVMVYGSLQKNMCGRWMTCYIHGYCYVLMLGLMECDIFSQNAQGQNASVLEVFSYEL